MLIAIRRVMLAMTKVVGALGLGGTIIWHVGTHSSVQKGLACVHVSAPDVDVTVDDTSYHVETLWESPIVFELGPGRHKLEMSRDGRVVDEQEFTLGMGEEAVLAMGDRSNETQLNATRPQAFANNPHEAFRCGRMSRR
jgi:hypothetical protein